jgi:mono/diheme cytochrome c family protein
MTYSLQAQTAPPELSSLHNDALVTPVTGESWLVHLNRSFGDTSMGKTGRLGPPPSSEDALGSPAMISTTFARPALTLSGSDLYRLNCQGCHGESGLGAPPEINSVIDPVRATSIPLVLERMKKTGMDISYADAAKLAQQSKVALLERLHKGGENMPPFTHLTEAEIHPLLAYLKQLADVPGASHEQTVVHESAVRIGELIVKSTCHTCHSAIGPDPGAPELMAGAIPPLSTLKARKNQSEFIRKVTQGAPVLIGTQLYRGRMPVFYYLTDEEAADVYLYLTLYPPSAGAEPTPLLAASQSAPSSPGEGPTPPTAPLATNGTAPLKPEPAGNLDVERAALPWTEALVALMLSAGLVFTFREFKRLSEKAGESNLMSHALRSNPGKPRPGRTLARSARPAITSTAKSSS